jgi:hypothetical protein
VKRRRLTLAVVGLLALAAAAHAWWWYWPRVRAGVPDPGDLPGRLLAEGDGDLVLWVAYPHQNLGALAGAAGGEEAAREWLAAAARRGGLPEPALPGFGPFPAPPARELAAVSDAAGRRVLVAARVYPLIAGVARLAGLLAGNPWLAGGEVEAFGGTARVTWDGTLWTVGTVAPAAVLTRAAAPTETGPPELAVARLGAPASFLPAGRYHLRSARGGLRLATDTARSGLPAPPADLLAATGAALLAVSGPGGPLEGEGSALALFAAGAGSSRLPGGLAVPDAAVWFRPGADRFGLPAEGLSSLLGGSGQDGGEAGAGEGGGGWRTVATGREAGRRAAALTPVVAALAPAVRLGLWARPAPALDIVDGVADVLASVPVAGREEAERWRDWRTLLSPLAPCRQVGLVATAEAFEATLEGCGI